MKTDKDIDINEYSEIFKALAHPTRLTIAYNLSKKAECNVSKMSECLGVPQPTVSQHLTILKNAMDCNYNEFKDLLKEHIELNYRNNSKEEKQRIKNERGRKEL